MQPSITIIGGGIAGLTTAIALKQIGLEVKIYEAAPKIEALGAGLVLAANAMAALNKLGLVDEVSARGKLLSSFTVCDHNGKVIMKKASEDISPAYGLDNVAIHRAELHRILLSKINKSNIITGKYAEKAYQTKDKVLVEFRDGTKLETNYLLAADGVHSPIRRGLLPESAPRYAGYTCWRAIIDQKDFGLRDAYEVWGPKGRFGFVPIADNHLYWFACINSIPNNERMKRYRIKDLERVFEGYYDPIPDILSHTQDDKLIWNDIVDIKPIPRYAYDQIVLLGDAAHATTPNLGQGACQAIEDAIILAGEMSSSRPYHESFQRFEKRRLKRTHYIINTSRRIGKAAQFENRALASFRNFVIRNMPDAVAKRQIDFLYQVDLGWC